jgi:hypothetical protein
MRATPRRVFSLAAVIVFFVLSVPRGLSAQTAANDAGAVSAPACSTKPTDPPPSGVQAALGTTSYGSPQTIVNLTITGKGLSKFNDIFFCYTAAPGLYLQNPDVPFIRLNEKLANPNFPDTSIDGTISVMPSALKGNYEVFLSDGKTTLFDTKAVFTVRDSNNGQYSECSTQAGPVIGNQALFCSQALLDYQQTYRIFGKGIADQYIAVEVTVRNLSDDFEYILHDIRLGTTNAVVASIDKKLVRAVGENTEQFTARAIAVRLTEATATAFTGVAGIVGNSLLTSVAALTAGPGLLGLKHAIPDLSVSELNRINDLSFATGGIVISKHAAVPMVAFLSSKVFAPGCLFEIAKSTTQQTVQGGTTGQLTDANSSNCKQKLDIKFKDLKTKDLMSFQQGLIVEVSGAHVQEIAQMTVTKVTGSPLDLPPLDLSQVTANTKETITLQGTGLDAATQMNLAGSGNNTLSYSVVAATTPDPTKAQFLIDLAHVPTAGNYTITLDTASQKGVKTGESLAVNSALSVSPSSLNFQQQASATQSVTITNKGDAQLTLLNAKLSGTDGASFSVVSGKTNGCGQPLDKAASCTYDVTFPTAAGPSGSRDGTLDITYGPGFDKVSVKLTGTATKSTGQ